MGKFPRDGSSPFGRIEKALLSGAFFVPRPIREIESSLERGAGLGRRPERVLTIPYSYPRALSRAEPASSVERREDAQGRAFVWRPLSEPRLVRGRQVVVVPDQAYRFRRCQHRAVGEKSHTKIAAHSAFANPRSRRFSRVDGHAPCIGKTGS